MQSWRQFLPYVWRLRKSLQCQLLLKLYCPSSSYINTHPKILAHMCAHWNTILILHLSDCYHVNENILLSDFCVSLYICSANALSWLEQFQIFELWNWEDCVVRLWKSLQYASLWGVCRYTRLRNKKKMYCLKGFSIKKSPVVWTQLSAVSELTSKPLNSLSVWLTACLSACLSPMTSGDVQRQRSSRYRKISIHTEICNLTHTVHHLH